MIFMSKVVFCSSNIIVAVPASSALAFAPFLVLFPDSITANCIKEKYEVVLYEPL